MNYLQKQSQKGINPFIEESKQVTKYSVENIKKLIPFGANKPQALNFVKLAIIDLVTFFNVPRSMNRLQVEQTAELLVKHYPYLTVLDIRYVFDQIKLGYKKIYEGLDGAKILGFVNEYILERIERFETYNDTKYREDENRSITKSQIAEIRKIISTWQAKNNEPKKVKNFDPAKYQEIKSQYIASKQGITKANKAL